MKLRRNHVDALAVTALLMGNALIAQGQGWETVFTVPPAQRPDSIYYYDRMPRAILPDPFAPPGSGVARLFVGLYDEHDFYLVNLTDGTSQGQLLSDPPGVGVKGLAYDPVSGNVFAISAGGWQVRRSSDQGASWTLVDSFPDAAAHAVASALALDNAGNIYVSGSTNAGNGTPTWLVRKSSDQGLTWSTVFWSSNQSSSGGMVFIAGSQGGLFVAGNLGGSFWTVRRSRDAGASWQIVDSFTKPGKGTSASRITSDAQGRVYVAGSSSPDPTAWEVRVSENGGATWKTISPSGAEAQINSNVGGIVVDPAGNLFVAGILDAWAVARRTPDGVWESPEFPFGTEAGWVPSAARAMAVDVLGNVYVGGHVHLRTGGPEGNQTTLVIQKLAATVLPPLVVRRSGTSFVLSWPAAVSGAQLESTATLGAEAVWENVTTPPVVIGDEQIVTVDIGPGSRFFRLRKP